MFFEDEKDDIIIDSDADIQISDDGTVSWDDILGDDDDLVSLKSQAETEVKPDIIQDEIPDDSLINLDDELQYVDNEDDDVDEEQLQKILNDETADSAPKQKAFDAFGVSEESQVQEQYDSQEEYSQDQYDSQDEYDSSEDFDIDAQLASATGAQAGQKILKDRSPRGEIKIGNNPKSNTSTLIAFLVAVLVGAGVYLFTNFSQKDISTQTPKQDIQEELNNTTQEDIQNRSEDNLDNIPVVNEEQLDEIKPVQEETETKEVVSVVQTGRIDPFLPLSKYTTVVENKKEKPIVIPKKVNKDDAFFVKPPSTLDQKNFAYIDSRALRNMDKIVVSGVMYNSKTPAAILSYDGGSYFVKIGDTVGPFAVKDIQRNYVVLSYGKYHFNAQVRREMHSDNINMVPGIVGENGKHYYKIFNKTDRNRDGEGEFDRNNSEQENYVSPDDIEVNERR